MVLKLCVKGIPFWKRGVWSGSTCWVECAAVCQQAKVLGCEGAAREDTAESAAGWKSGGVYTGTEDQRTGWKRDRQADEFLSEPALLILSWGPL